MADQTAQTLITAVRALDPFNPMQKRTAQFQVGATLQTCFDELAYVIPEHQDLVLFLNGQPVMRAGWDYATQAGDHVYIKPFPRGGDSGGFRQVAQIGLAAAAMYVGGPAGAAIMMGGSLALNEFMPLPKPPTPQQVQPFSNTYQSQSRGNVPKPMQAMPEQFGELEIYPDEGARAYFAYEGNKQVYYQLLCIGRGDYALEESTVKLAGEPFSYFENGQLEIVQKGENLTLVNPSITPVQLNQVELPDQTLNMGSRFFDPTGIGTSYGFRDHQFYSEVSYLGDWINFDSRVSGFREGYLNVTAGDHIKLYDASNGTYSDLLQVAGVEYYGYDYPQEIRVLQSSLPASTVSFIADREDSGISAFRFYPVKWDVAQNEIARDFEPFTIDSPTNITAVQIDYAMPPSGKTVKVGLAIRPIDSNNIPVGLWQQIEQRTLTPDPADTLNLTETFDIPVGRYQVALYRTDYKYAQGNRVYVRGVKGVGTTEINTAISENCTLLALKVEVPLDQNITLGETRVVAKRKLPVLQANGTWSAPQATSQISAAIAEALRIRYGSDFENYLMPLDELYALQQTWTARGDEFNGRFDQQVVLKEAMQLIARVGRAVALEVGDRWYIIRDEPGVATYPYGPANIVADPNTAEPFYSLQDKYPLPDDPDGIIVEFFNRDVWEWDETPSYPTNAVQPKRIRFFGITDKLHAWRECCYLYYREIIKSTTITWRTELEALNHGYGDLISIAPPKSRIYGAGVIKEFNAVTGELELSEPPQWSDSGYHFINLRRDDGTMSGPYEVRKGATDNHCILKPGTALDITPHNGITVTPQREPTHYQFGKTSTGLLVRLIGRKSVGTHTFDMLGEIETDAKHTVDQTPYPA